MRLSSTLDVCLASEQTWSLEKNQSVEETEKKADEGKGVKE